MQGYRIVSVVKIFGLKIPRRNTKGIEQTWHYFDRSDAEAAHLVIFNRDETVPWAEKVFRAEESFNDLSITVWGM